MINKKFIPELDAQFAILDTKAVLKHCLGAGEDENCLFDSVNGREVNTAEHGFRVFLDYYLKHLLVEEGYAPWQILVVHEGGHAYRSSVNPDYKMNRKPKEGEKPKKGPEGEEQYVKLETYTKNFMAGLGATQLHVSGVEGDDVISHLVEKLSPNYVCSVYTVDADLLKLASPTCRIFLKRKPIYCSYDMLLDAEDVVPKNMHEYLKSLCDQDGYFLEEVNENIWQFITLYKSICGDSSDGYNGVKGLGDKAWKDLIAEFDIDGLQELEEIVSGHKWVDLKEIVDSLDEGTGKKLLTKLYENRQLWRQSFVLAELHPELCWKPFNNKITKINWFKRVPNAERVLKVLNDCDAMYDQNGENYYEEIIEELMPQKFLIDSANYEGDEIDDFKELAQDTFAIGFDYETDVDEEAMMDKDKSLNVIESQPTGVSFCLGNNFQYAFYLTFDHKDSNNLDIGLLKDFIEAVPSNRALVAHNLKFETIVTAKSTGLLLDQCFDTAVISSYVDENEEMGLKACSKRDLNYTQETYDEVLEKAGARSMRGVTAEQVMSYGIDDSIVTCHLFALYWLRLQLEETWDFYEKYEPTFTKRMAISEMEGVNVDFDELQQLKEEDQKCIEDNTAKLRSILGKHCQKVNKKAALEYFETEKDWISSNERFKLEGLKEEELVKKVVAARTYFEKLMELDEKGGEIYHNLGKLVKFLEADTKKDSKYVASDDFNSKEAVKHLVKTQLYKQLKKYQDESVYVPYTEEVIAAKVAPTPAKLSEVASMLDLPEIKSVASSRMSAWMQEVLDVDFDSDDDEATVLRPDQQEFVDLLRDALPYFKPDMRGHSLFKKFEAFLAKKLDIKSKVEYSGTELNTGSSQQMQHLFYCMLGLPVRLRGNVQKGSARHKLGFDGSPSTDALAVDTALAEDVEGVEGMEWVGEALTCIKRIKESETRMSLYFNAYPTLINPVTERMHPSIKSCGTVTRRPSGSSPNILQVSKHQKGGIMRSIFKPIREDHIIVAIDFAGQELRILASETKDENLLSAYLGENLANKYLEMDKAGQTWEIKTTDIVGLDDVKDLHSNTAANIVHYFGLDSDGKLVAGGDPDIKSGKMDYEQFIGAFSDKDHQYYSLCQKVRKKPAKNTNFLMAYGGSGQSLAQKLIIKESEGNKIMDSTLELYSGIGRAQAETVRFAKQYGYSLTAYGNRRHATKDLFGNNSEQNRMGRQLFNYKIQGCAADILKDVVYSAEHTHEEPIWDRLDAVLMAPVYDEIVASVPWYNAVDYVKEMREYMNILPPNQAVPMMADISLGPDWQKQNELGPFPTDEEVSKAAKEAFEQRQKQIADKAA